MLILFSLYLKALTLQANPLDVGAFRRERARCMLQWPHVGAFRRERARRMLHLLLPTSPLHLYVAPALQASLRLFV